MSSLRFAGLPFVAEGTEGIYVTDISVPTWIYVDNADENITSIVFSTYLPFADGSDVDLLDALVLANDISSEYKPNQIYVTEGRLSAIFYLFVGEGLSEEFFVHCLKTVSSSFSEAVREYDVNSIVHWP